MDEACLEKLGTMLIGVSVAGVALAGAGVPPGILEGGVAGAGLFLRLKGQRRSDADAVLRNLKQVIRQEWQAWGQTASFANEYLRASVVASFEQVIPRCAIPAAGVVGVRLDPDQVAHLVLAQAEAALPVVYASKDPRNVESHHARLFLLNVTRRAYAALLAEPGYIDRIAPDLWRGVLEGIEELKDKIDHQSAELAEIREMLVRQTNADRPGFAEEHAELILALAERYLPEPTSDFMAAYRGIKAALLEYDRMRAEPALPANTGDQINALLERLDALNNTGSFDDGAKLLATAREAARDRIDRETSELLRLLDRTVLQSRFRNKPDEAAAALVEKLRLNTPPSLFKALRGLWDEWYIRGRDGGMNFEAEVAIHLAQAILSNATGPDQRGTALNVLGNALRALGQREAGTARLEQAVEAYRAALTERTQDRVPLQWAITQMNLGTALLFLGRREAGTARLEEAVAAYRAALTEFKQDRVPLDWATTQMNLGNALSTLGEREEGTALLEQAVDAFRAALTELTQNRVPLEWAATQNSLGLVLSQLGVREGGTERLEEAVEAFHAALTEYRQDRVPLDWARTQMNLGNALAALGEFEEGTALLEQTVEAYRAGLTEVTQDRVPLDWATAQNNLGIVLGWLGEREEGTERLEEAVVAYRAALEEVTRDRAPMDWARTLANEGMTLLTLADRTDDPARARQALDQLTLAEATLRSGGHIPWADNCARQIPAAQALVDRLSAGQP